MTQISFFYDVLKSPWDIQVPRKLKALGVAGSLKMRDLFGFVRAGILRNYILEFKVLRQ